MPAAIVVDDNGLVGLLVVVVLILIAIYIVRRL
jgi:flagellar biogenesis protein FliO